MPNLRPILSKQFVTQVGDLPTTYFTKVSGLQESYDETEYNDGEKGRLFVHVGFMKIDKVTLSKPFDPAQDVALIQWYQGQKTNRQPFTVTIQPVSADLNGSPIAGAKTLTLTGCTVTRMKYPDVDRESSSAIAMLEIDVYPQDVTYQ